MMDCEKTHLRSLIAFERSAAVIVIISNNKAFHTERLVAPIQPATGGASTVTGCRSSQRRPSGESRSCMRTRCPTLSSLLLQLYIRLSVSPVEDMEGSTGQRTHTHANLIWERKSVENVGVKQQSMKFLLSLKSDLNLPG